MRPYPGAPAKILPAGWLRYADEGTRRAHAGRDRQTVVRCPADGPYRGMLLLSYPLFWFRPEEVEILPRP